jgi:hypothetical protein
MLVLSPLLMMAAFVSASLVWISVPWQLGVLASAPYMVLGAGAGLMCLWTHPRRGPLFMVIPATCLAIIHASEIASRAAELRRSAALPPSVDYVSAEQVIGMNYAAGGVIFGLIALVWTTIVVMRARARGPRKGPEGLCWKCNYDRAGLAADAKCPECGASPS